MPIGDLLEIRERCARALREDFGIDVAAGFEEFQCSHAAILAKR